MALWRAAGLCRHALRAHWADVRLLSVGAGGKLLSGEEKQRRVDSEALRPERALRPPAERAQPEPPRKVFGTARPTREQVQLNSAIRECGSVDEVLDLVARRSALLNGVIVPTALSVIARGIGKRESALWLKSDTRFRQLMRAALLMMESGAMDAQGFSNTLYACGQLGLAPPPSWLRAYWDASALKLGDFVPQALSNTLYACSQLGVIPPADWMQRFWDASALNMGEFVPQALSNTLYAAGQLGIAPPADWLHRFWDASSWIMGEFNLQDFSNTLYACGQLRIIPPEDWMLRFWHASAVKLGDFTPQHFSNTLYACGQLRIAPPADWLLRFWHASALKLGAFVPQNFSNTLYACGQLGVVPPSDWLQRVWYFSALKLPEFIPQHFSNLTYACGELQVTPPSDWLHVFSRECERALPDMNQQDLANTTFALAALGLWELPLWPGLWKRLCLALSRDIGGWSTEDRIHAMQLYQAYMAAAVERPGFVPTADSELLAAARKCWFDGLSTDNARSSKLHADVSASLTHMGIAHANERWCERAERSIDIAIEGAARVAVEVDGPYHFLQDGRQDGSTALRNRMLTAHGWRVVVVDYRIWDGQPAPALREEYLRSLLA